MKNNRKTNGGNTAGRRRQRGADPREDEDDPPQDLDEESGDGEWGDVLPPEGEFRCALFEIRQPGNARDYLGTYTREQVGEDLATFLGQTFGGGLYAWKLKNSRGKWAKASEARGHALGGEVRISERTFPRLSANNPATAAAAAPAGPAGVDLVSLLMQRESKAHELLLKAIEGGAARAAPAAPPMGIGDLVTMFKVFKDLSPSSPVNNVKDLAEAMAALRDVFPQAEGGGSEFREFGELIQALLSQQAPAALPAAAAPGATAPAQQQQRAPAQGGAKGMQAKLLAAVAKLPGFAAQAADPAQVVDALLYDWTARECDQLEAVLPGVTIEKVKPYLKEFDKYQAWYESFFKALNAYFAEDTPETT